MTTNLICESPAPAVRVVRFLRPDLREVIYDGGTAAETTLYKELHATAIEGLPEGGAVILNFGLVDWFPTTFYGLLLQALRDLRARRARLLLCCMTPNVKECHDLMGGGQLFAVHNSEAKALAVARR